MLKALIVLAIVFVALFAVGYNIIVPDGYLNALGQPFGADLSVGGGNPLALVTDPLIATTNSALNTNWGFIIVLTIIALIFAYLRETILIALGLSYAVYIIGLANGLPYLSYLVIGTLIITSILAFIATGGKRKTDKLKGVIKWSVILLVIAVIALFLLNQAGYLIPGWNSI